MLNPANEHSICYVVSDDSTTELQTSSLAWLEAENQRAAQRLTTVVQQGELLLSHIQRALHDIAQLQLHNQTLEQQLS